MVGNRTISDVVVDLTVAVNQNQRSGRTETLPLWAECEFSPYLLHDNVTDGNVADCRTDTGQNDARGGGETGKGD